MIAMMKNAFSIFSFLYNQQTSLWCSDVYVPSSKKIILPYSSFIIDGNKICWNSKWVYFYMCILLNLSSVFPATIISNSQFKLDI